MLSFNQMHFIERDSMVITARKKWMYLTGAMLLIASFLLLVIDLLSLDDTWWHLNLFLVVLLTHSGWQAIMIPLIGHDMFHKISFRQPCGGDSLL